MTSSSVTGLWKKFSSKFSKPSQYTPNSVTVIPRDEHCVSRKNISDAAIKVIRRLNEEGYDAFLVGGGVRDLLLGGHPKDFDIATNATPEQVRGVFRNSRIIGRRFRIVKKQLEKVAHPVK